MTVPRGKRWQDHSPEATFEEKVKRAARHFQKKGMAFAAVYVYPHPDLPERVHGLSVRQDESIMPSYLHFVTAAQLALDKSTGGVV